MLLGDLLIFLLVAQDFRVGELAAEVFVTSGNVFQTFKHKILPALSRLWCRWS